jgi:hypothetical protein
MEPPSGSDYDRRRDKVPNFRVFLPDKLDGRLPEMPSGEKRYIALLIGP